MSKYGSQLLRITLQKQQTELVKSKPYGHDYILLLTMYRCVSHIDVVVGVQYLQVDI